MKTAPMKIFSIVSLALCLFFTCNFDGCGVAATPGTPAGGFPVTTYSVTEDSSGNILSTGVVPYTEVSGNWVSGGTGGSVTSFGVTSPFLTDGNGNGFVSNGVVNADWTTTVGWPSLGCPAFSSANTGALFVDPIDGIQWTCIFIVTTEEGNTSTHYALSGAAPSTITAYGNFSTTYGSPGLRVYVGGSSPSLVDVKSATSTQAGSSAVFPFPTQSSGSPLGEGFYGLVSTSVNSAGNAISTGSPSYLAIGGSTTLSSAFGVDAADIHYYTTSCSSKGCVTINDRHAPAPILTQYYAGSVVSYTGATIPVGIEPVAIKTYGGYLGEVTKGGLHFFTDGPANAIVANSGSSSVSIVSFSTNTDLKNIAVGSQPMALTLNSAATYAYVASYGNGSLAEVNLSTEAVTRTLTGLTGALSVAMDPSGSYVWVGGTNSIYKVSLSTFAVASSVAVTGSVTSLAMSNAQNELVYTLVQGCCTGSSTYAANELLLSNLSQPGTYAHATASPFAAYTMNGTLPTAAVLPQATNVVSARFSNGMGASSTPTGFVIYDLVTHAQIMVGTTPTPVRGIATDPDCMFAYFTLPDSNEYISVPLEYAP